LRRFLYISYKIWCLGIVLCCYQSSLSQKEAANWYFGNNAGLNFNTEIPTPITDSVLNTLEGCASISSDTGTVLFYTDGITIWNKNNTVMANGNGLLGSASATQSALIVPKPGSPNIYYVFTSDVVQAYVDGGDGNGLNYSIVDMNQNGGLGVVIEKNVNLLPKTSEKITAIGTTDGVGVWVITHYEDGFYSYLVTNLGVSASPVISIIGPSINNFNNIRGALKASPNGDQLAVAHAVFKPEFGGGLFLYDFDKTTGEIDNELLLDEDLLFYGIGFSSNSSKIYASGKSINSITGTTEIPYIIEYDLDAINIPDSRVQIAEFEATSSDLAGALQLAMDKKIYHALPNSNLSVIKMPNEYGELTDFELYQVDLGGRFSKFGLPPFIQTFFESIVEFENNCLNTETQFRIVATDPIDSVQWNFGDPTSSNNTSNDFAPTHVYTRPGNYSVTLEVEFTDKPSQTFIEVVEILGPPGFVNITVTDNPLINSLEIEVLDPETYLYSIDNGATFQSETLFENLSIGFYSPQIWSKGCLIYEATVNVGGVPRFFTPNGDGYNDTWTIPGIKKQNGVSLQIFDRYGKLLKEIINEVEGWDGKHDGKLLPTSDYWYIVEFADGKKVRATK